MAVRIVRGLQTYNHPPTSGRPLRSTRGIWMEVRIVWGIPEVVGWQ